ncbi:MAG: DUF3362 domain-containing protein [Thermoguttaceae bacterium]|nr:DUF3362 domain-containing protein [Thermoguttaceae bacterium]
MSEPSQSVSLFEDPERATRPNLQTPDPLPMSREEIERRGWDEVDVVFITGDAYVDSPSFANGLLARVLEADGFRVAVLSQPDWNSVDDFRKLGRPRLAFCVSAGNMDSMLNHYTANRKIRNDDAYSPGGVIGRRPDRATLAYCQRARQAFPGTPVIAGGIEASLRRIAHYDYWSDRVRRSILLDSKADLLLYGMGERPILEVMRRLAKGEPITSIRDVRGSVYRLGKSEDLLEESDTVAHLPSYEEVSFDENVEKRAAEKKSRELLDELKPLERRLDRLFAEIDPAKDEKKRLERELLANRDAILKEESQEKEPDPQVLEEKRRLDALKELADQRLDELNAEINRAKARTHELKNELQKVKSAPEQNERSSKEQFVKMTQIAYANLNPYCAKTLLQECGEEAIVVNPPAFPLSEEEMDAVYALPFTRRPHPSYTETIPAVEVVRSTVQTHRGCFGGCSFCAITAHQGKFIQSRSEDAILKEIRQLADANGGDYVVSDLNAPTANMYRLGGKNKDICKTCRRVSCLCPTICQNLDVDQSRYVELLRRARAVEGVKKVLIASGIRTDLAIFSVPFIAELAANHTGGHLKTAPEHVDNDVLRLMNKPPIENYEEFVDVFTQESIKAGKEQYCIPYLISGFPGCTLAAMVEVAVYLKKHDVRPEQVQDFIPAPFQPATCAYYTGIDPISGEEVYVPKTLRERRLQRALLFYYNPECYYDVKSALQEAGRTDLVGDSEDSLIPRYVEKSATRLRSSQIVRKKKETERDIQAAKARRAQFAEFDPHAYVNEPRDEERRDDAQRGGKRVGREKTGDGYRGGARNYGRDARERRNFGGSTDAARRPRRGDFGQSDARVAGERRQPRDFDSGRERRDDGFSKGNDFKKTGSRFNDDFKKRDDRQKSYGKPKDGYGAQKRFDKPNNKPFKRGGGSNSNFKRGGHGGRRDDR